MIVARAALYDVPPDCYLFRDKINKPEHPPKPEEKVRQWCLQELIRAYGFHIADLDVEVQVQVGSKIYRIDVLIRRNGRPWAVVEVKSPTVRDLSSALEQAISYANGSGINAEMVIVTNGEEWLFRRRTGENWTGVPDLPLEIESSDEDRLFQLLHGIQLVSVVLCKVDEQVDGDSAKTYISALQRFFHGPNIFTRTLNQDLVFGVDVLLRSVGAPVADNHYREGTLRGAYVRFEAYREKLGLQQSFEWFDGDSVELGFRTLSSSLEGALDEIGPSKTPDYCLLRVAAAMAHYERSRGRAKQYGAIPEALLASVRDLLELLVPIGVGAQLPSRSQSGSMSDIHYCCAGAWREFAESESD